MLETLGECLSLVRTTGSAAASASSTANVPLPSLPVIVYGTPTGLSPRRYPALPMPPPLHISGIDGNGAVAVGFGTGFSNEKSDDGGVGVGEKKGEGAAGVGVGSVVSLRTLILGRCEKVSSSAFEAFLSIAGGGGGGGDGVRGGRTRTGASNSAGSQRSQATAGVGSREGGGQGNGDAAAGGGAPSGRSIALSSVRLTECKDLDDRGLRLLATGAKDRLKALQVRTPRHHLVKWGRGNGQVGRKSKELVVGPARGGGGEEGCCDYVFFKSLRWIGIPWQGGVQGALVFCVLCV